MGTVRVTIRRLDPPAFSDAKLFHIHSEGSSRRVIVAFFIATMNAFGGPVIDVLAKVFSREPNRERRQAV